MTGPHHLSVRVYYEDTDFSGAVYHASYLRFMERGRTELLRQAGIDQSALHGGLSDAIPMSFAVRRMTIDFVRPARMDDVLTVETAIEALGGASVTLRQCIRRDGAVLVEAMVKIAFLGAGRPRRLPSGLAARLRAPPAAADGSR